MRRSSRRISDQKKNDRLQKRNTKSDDDSDDDSADSNFDSGEINNIKKTVEETPNKKSTRKKTKSTVPSDTNQLSIENNQKTKNQRKSNVKVSTLTKEPDSDSKSQNQPKTEGASCKNSNDKISNRAPKIQAKNAKSAKLSVVEANIVEPGYLEISIDDPNAPELPYDDEEDEDEENDLKGNLKQNSIQSKWDRALRLSMRKANLLTCLISLKWLSRLYGHGGDPIILSTLLSLVPRNLQRHLSPEEVNNCSILNNGISMLATWWKNTVKLRGAKILRNESVNIAKQKSNISRRQQKSSKGTPSPKQKNPLKIYGNVSSSFHNNVKSDQQKSKNGKREKFENANRHLPRAMSRLLQGQTVGEAEYVAMFVGILRALGMECRLVRSLQLIPSKPTTPSLSKSGYPVWWLELYHHSAEGARWTAIDPIRALLDSRKSMEPPAGLQTRTGHQHTWIVAAGPQGWLTDVTRRYCSLYHTVTCRQRRILEDCFSDSMKRLNGKVSPPFFYDEEAELSNLVQAEPMPTTIGAFKMHGKYVLEGHLKKYQVFWPPEPVGEFRGEAVYLRENVQPVRSKEAWFTQYGRVIREGEVPCKSVKLPKRPSQGGEEVVDERPLQPLYGEWQTEPYRPPAAKDGKVPRNEYGNVDLFQPTMLPLGCAYIPYTEAWKAAKQLGVDYANACTRFAFHGRMAIPNIKGIVVCLEDEEAVLDLHQQLAEEAQRAAIEAAEEEDRKRARLEQQSIRIAERIQTEYADLVDEVPQKDGNVDSSGEEESTVMIESVFSSAAQSKEMNIEDDKLFD